MQTLVQLQVDQLSEFGVALVALERPVATVQPYVGLEVRCGRKTLAASAARIRLFASVHQNVLLQVGQLSEALGTRVALERTLARVHPQVHLQVGQLAERFFALLALGSDLWPRCAPVRTSHAELSELVDAADEEEEHSCTEPDIDCFICAKIDILRSFQFILAKVDRPGVYRVPSRLDSSSVGLAMLFIELIRLCEITFGLK
ncbi:hypothetical protein BpHYR1_009543 [Brachionus plicatilis]|uniref:Uncharacterized protein n=1 Tax=Brachionus plicatilis TaxID=10195 RepID=A0A3M7Q449_BRAPC|nr:hypothetical protein BpHYR1_009543 [Brachionus plicatilis]